MEKRARIIIAIILVVIVAVAAYRYKSYIVDRNFVITAQSACDPSTHDCFVLDCDPNDDTCDPAPYKKVTMLASEAPACLLEHACDTNLECSTTASESCAVAYCSEDTLEDGELCTESTASQVIPL